MKRIIKNKIIRALIKEIAIGVFTILLFTFLTVGLIIGVALLYSL